ncbi:uncharacterized protein LOC134721217 isoform X2 [Mytilus trossulus]
MHIWVSTAIITLLVFEVYTVDGALTVSYYGTNKVNSTTYGLKCGIPIFISQAVWSKAGTSMSTCFISGCLTTSSPPYRFRHSTSAIYVDFSVLTANETGIQWTCAHIGDTMVHFKVEVDLTPEREELLVDPEDSNVGLSSGVKAGIGVGSIIAAMGLVLIGILIVKQRKKNSSENERMILTSAGQPSTKSTGYEHGTSNDDNPEEKREKNNKNYGTSNDENAEEKNVITNTDACQDESNDRQPIFSKQEDN